MLKSVIALIAGFAIMTFTILVATIVAASVLPFTQGAPTTQFLALNVFYSAAAAAFGGYATASLAPERPSAHVLILAVMVLIMGASSFLAPQPGQERWNLAAVLVLSPICVFLGGRVREAQRRRSQAGGASDMKK